MEEEFRKTKVYIMISFVLVGALPTLLAASQTVAWSNGGYSADPNNPDYGTHDWIAEHALDWLPGNEKQYILNNLQAYLYGTELPDNGGAPDGIGDSFKHHVYYYSSGSLQDDISAIRAQQEYDDVLNYLTGGNDALAAKYAGVMSHYIVDVSVFGHVMGSSTDWGAETHHSDYENYVRDRTTGYHSSEFDPYLVFDGDLVELDAFDAVLDVAFVSTFGDGGDVRSCAWMDGNYDWSDAVFRDSAGASLNLAVNKLADVLHGIAVGVGVPVDETGVISGSVKDVNGNLLSGATVELRDVGSGIVVDALTTDSNGGFEFSDVAYGDYKVLVTREGYVGYETVTLSISEGGSTVEVGDIELERSPEVGKGSSQSWMWMGVGLLAGMVGVLVALLVVKRRKGADKEGT